jgi:alpha-glucoside transport system substrate-binding protein
VFARQKLWPLVALLLVGLLVLSCGPTPEPEIVERVITQVIQETVIVAGTPEVIEKEVTKVVEVEKEVAVTVTPEPREIVFMAGWGGEGKEALLKMIEPFTARTGIPVRYEESRSLEALVRTRLAGGNSPDVILETMPGAIAEFARAGNLVPLEDPVGNEIFKPGELEAIYPVGLLELTKVDGIQYGFPFKADSKSLFFYDPRKFQEIGVEPPKTWEELKAVADASVAAGIAPFAVGGGADSWVLTDWFENILIRVASPQVYNDLHINHGVAWTDPSVVKALTLMGELFGTPGYLAGGPDGVLGTSFGESVAQVFGENPTALMIYEGGFVGPTAMNEINPALVEGESIDLFLFPQIEPEYDDPIVGGADFAILFQDTPEGRAFMQYLASKEAAEIMASTDKIAPHKEVDPSVYPTSLTRQQHEQVINAVTFVFDGSDMAPSAFGGDFEGTKLQDLVAHPDEIDRISEEMETYAQTVY